MKYGENKIIKVSVALTTVLNIFISIIEIRYIEFIYILIFIGFNIYVRGTKTHNEKENITYVEKKEIVKSNKVLFIGTNILIFFYILFSRRNHINWIFRHHHVKILHFSIFCHNYLRNINILKF